MRQRQVLLLALACFVLAAILSGTIHQMQRGVVHSTQSESQILNPSLQGISSERSKSRDDPAPTSEKSLATSQFGKSLSQWLDVEDSIKLEVGESIMTEEERATLNPEDWFDLNGSLATEDPEDWKVSVTFWARDLGKGGDREWNDYFSSWATREDIIEAENSDEMLSAAGGIDLSMFRNCEIVTVYETFDCWGNLRFYSERFYDNSRHGSGR